MSKREKLLFVIIVGAVAIFLNLLLFKFFSGKYTEYRQVKLKAERDLAMYKILESEREKWAMRDAWLTGKLAPMGDRDVTNKNQREALLAVAKEHEVIIDPPAPGVPSALTHYMAFATRIECKGKWENFIYFLHGLQNPENFTVIDGLDFKVDPTDKTQFKASITVSRWFSPKS